MRKRQEDRFGRGENRGIYRFARNKEKVDTRSLFDCSRVGEKLRVENKHVNYLFRNLDEESFEAHYNDYARRLDLNFTPCDLGGKTLRVTDDERAKIEQKIILDMIYFYNVNNLAIEIKKSDFNSSNPARTVKWVLEKRFGKDSVEALTLGAHILRLPLQAYKRTNRAINLHDNR